MRTYDEKLGGWMMPYPVDLHQHCRMGEMQHAVVPLVAEHYRYITAMPNLGENRIRTPEQAVAYREDIRAIGRKVNPRFDLNVPLYLEPDTEPNVVRQGCEQDAWIAAKLYPKGGTTQSAEGVDFRELDRLDPAFDVIRECGMALLIHAEPQFAASGKELDVFDRETLALPYVEDILRKHRGIKVSFEHASTAVAAQCIIKWKDEGHNIGATVAPQYLAWNRNSLFRGGMNPIHYSIPVLKRESDRQALIRFVTEYNIAYLGTDSAPHPMSAKSRCERCPGGVFNSPVALFKYLEFFRASGHADWFDRFVEFACFRGPRLYGVPVDEQDSVLIKEAPWVVPDRYPVGDSDAVIPMCAGEQMKYDLVPLV